MAIPGPRWLQAAACWLAAVAAPGLALAQQADLRLTTSPAAVQQSCAQLQAGGAPELDAWYHAGTAHRLQLGSSNELEADMQSEQSRVHVRRRSDAPELAALSIDWVIIRQDDVLSGVSLTLEDERGPVERWTLDGRCRAVDRRRLVHPAGGGAASAIVVLVPGSAAVERIVALNPPVPEASPNSAAANAPDPQHAAAVRVALVDAGVNYLLPSIAARLARDEAGNLVGYDFWDMDDRPFDAQFSKSPFHVLRHGTRTASVLLREAPAAALVPYRYPRPEMTRMADLVRHAAANEVRIVGLPLGGSDAEQWQSFADEAARHPGMLFIASAGNQGRNIDEQPVYPAALELDNLLVVTSSDDFAQPAERVNWGPTTVDYLLPAEHQAVTDFDGTAIEASGSSYAVPRLMAAAARLLELHPNWQAEDLIKRLARPFADGTRSGYVKLGLVPDPLAIAEPAWQPMAVAHPWVPDNADDANRLSVDVAVLDSRWAPAMVQSILAEASGILAQCSLGIAQAQRYRFQPPERLRDLATGPAHTLMQALRGYLPPPARQGTRRPLIVFARDTAMAVPFDGEAFGRGNTEERAWLQDSVWLTGSAEDAGMTLAHELFHVLSDSGEHVEDAGNLMANRTVAGQSMLSESQCALATVTASELGLIALD